jgi:hypothetical protein
MARRFKVRTLLSNSGIFNNEVTAPNLVYNTGTQTISGLQTFNSGIVSLVGITGTNLVYNTGNQNISGIKNFISRPTVNGTGVLLSGELPATIVYTTGDQTIGGLKTFSNGLISTVGITGENLVYNTGNQIISGNLTISGHYENLSTLSVQRVSGMNNIYGGALIIQGVNDQTIFLNPVGVTYPGSILLNAGTGLNNGTGTKGKIEFLGNLDINIVNPFLAGDNLKNSREFAERKINIWKTGITNDGFLRGYSGITIDNENIYLNTPLGGATGFGLIISGAQVTPNLYVNTTGTQSISGIKTFTSDVIMSGNLQVSGTGIFDSLDLNNIDSLSLSGIDITITSGVVSLTNPLSAPNLVYNTGNQTISGIKTFATGIFDKASGNLILFNSATAPLSPAKGQLFFDTINNNFSGYNGTSWLKLNN